MNTKQDALNDITPIKSQHDTSESQHQQDSHTKITDFIPIPVYRSILTCNHRSICNQCQIRNRRIIRRMITQKQTKITEYFKTLRIKKRTVIKKLRVRQTKITDFFTPAQRT